MKKIILGFILGVIISGTVGVLASTIISSNNVTYQSKTLNTALDELYNEATTGKELIAAAITNKGITTTSADTYETIATNISSIDTDHTEINQKLNNLESKHNSDIASLTGSISRTNQNLTGNNDNLSLADSNCSAWYENSIDKIGHRVFVTLSVQLKVSIAAGQTVIVAAVPGKYLPKNQYTSFPAVSNEGNSLFGYVDRSTNRIVIVSQKGGDKYITASFSYESDL